jgi:hypothetical protein
MVDYRLGLIARIAGHANTGTGSLCEGAEAKLGVVFIGARLGTLQVGT